MTMRKKPLERGMIFNTMSEMKLFLYDYVVYHHRPYSITHSDQKLRYHVICKKWLYVEVKCTEETE